MRYSSNEDSESSDEEFCCYNVVDSLQQKNKPNLTFEERKLMHTYTYDKEPVKEWRQVNDYPRVQQGQMERDL